MNVILNRRSLYRAGLVCLICAVGLLTAFNSLGQAATFNLLPSIDTDCPKLRSGPQELALAASGKAAGSSVHIACVSQRRRLLYRRYRADRGIVEKISLRGGLLRGYGDAVSYRYSVHAIAYSRGYTYVAWIGRDRIFVARRHSEGHWEAVQLGSANTGGKVDPMEVTLAADGDTAYVAWTNHYSCEVSSPPSGCWDTHVRFAQVKGSQVLSNLRVLPGPEPCKENYSDLLTTHPSVAVDEQGPILALEDNCQTESHQGLRVFRIERGQATELVQPPSVEPAGLISPHLSVTSEGVYLMYLSVSSSRDRARLGVLISKLTGEQWGQVEKIDPGRNTGSITVVGHDLWASAGYIVTLGSEGWNSILLAQGGIAAALISVGENLYFDLGFTHRLGHARVND